LWKIFAAESVDIIPSDFAVLIRGDYEEQQKAYRELIVGIVLAIMLVYLVMAGSLNLQGPTYNSFSIPMALIVYRYSVYHRYSFFGAGFYWMYNSYRYRGE
jgi:multidrug efflux pump subunit AcrB